MGILLRVSKIWFSEVPLALRTKQAIAAVLPRAALVSPKKRYYSSLLKHPEQYMEDDAAALKRLVAPGDFVIDVGAFVGFYNALLSQLAGPTGEVWTIEPMPEVPSSGMRGGPGWMPRRGIATATARRGGSA